MTGQRGQLGCPRYLDHPERCKLHCRRVDGEHILGMLVPLDGGRERKTLACAFFNSRSDVLARVGLNATYAIMA